MVITSKDNETIKKLRTSELNENDIIQLNKLRLVDDKIDKEDAYSNIELNESISFCIFCVFLVSFSSSFKEYAGTSVSIKSSFIDQTASLARFQQDSLLHHSVTFSISLGPVIK